MQKALVEPVKAIGTLTALPRLPSTRIGCHQLYICNILVYIVFLTNISPLGNLVPILVCIYCKIPSCLVLIKENSVAAVDQSHNGKENNSTFVHFPSIHPSRWLVHSWHS
jgi:hypothetical protein